MKAYLTSPKSFGAIEETSIEAPTPTPSETLVRVTHFSLNRGELHFAQSLEPGRAVGWDIAGVVEQSSADGSGPAKGSRVVAFSRAQQGWAELVAIPNLDLSKIPDGVDSAIAASLPVAALTALYALERGERHLGSRVLVTGATGGVGSFAVSLAALMGADVVAQVRDEAQVDTVRSLGAGEVIVTADGAGLEKGGPYRLILDGLGNELTARALLNLSPDGRAIIYGVTAGNSVEISPGFFLGTGSGRVEGFNLYRESERESISRGLDRLLNLILQGKLNPLVERQGSWKEAPQLAQDLLDRKFGGKAVLAV